MNDKKILQEAITETGLLAQSKVAWIVHPTLEDMAIKFAGYVGPHSVTMAGKPLLNHALKDAFSKYKIASESGEDGQAAIRQFSRCLLAHSIEVFSQELVVETSSGDMMWMPFVCGALEFTKPFPVGAVVSCRWVESRISEAIATAFMMTKLLPPAMLDRDSLAELLGETKATG